MVKKEWITGQELCDRSDVHERDLVRLVIKDGLQPYYKHTEIPLPPKENEPLAAELRKWEKRRADAMVEKELLKRKPFQLPGEEKALPERNPFWLYGKDPSQKSGKDKPEKSWHEVYGSRLEKDLGREMNLHRLTEALILSEIEVDDKDREEIRLLLLGRGRSKSESLRKKLEGLYSRARNFIEKEMVLQRLEELQELIERCNSAIDKLRAEEPCSWIDVELSDDPKVAQTIIERLLHAEYSLAEVKLILEPNQSVKTQPNGVSNPAAVNSLQKEKDPNTPLQDESEGSPQGLSHTHSKAKAKPLNQESPNSSFARQERDQEAGVRDTHIKKKRKRGRPMKDDIPSKVQRKMPAAAKEINLLWKEMKKRVTGPLNKVNPDDWETAALKCYENDKFTLLQFKHLENKALYELHSARVAEKFRGELLRTIANDIETGNYSVESLLAICRTKTALDINNTEKVED